MKCTLVIWSVPILVVSFILLSAREASADQATTRGFASTTPSSSNLVSILSVSNNWGVFIGINRFGESSIARLRYCASDAKGLHDALVEDAKVIPADHALLLTSDEPKESKDHPDRIRVMKAIQYACKSADSNSLLVVSISSHGFTDKSGDSFILPIDGDRDLPKDTCLSLTRLNQMLQESRATKKILIVDACRDTYLSEDKGPGDVLPAQFFRAMEEASGQLSMVACGAGQVAHEDEAAQHGVYTYYLIQGIKGYATNANGLVMAHELHQYALKRTKEWCARNRKEMQEPLILGNSSGDIPLAVFGNVSIDSVIINSPRVLEPEWNRSSPPPELTTQARKYQRSSPNTHQIEYADFTNRFTKRENEIEDHLLQKVWIIISTNEVLTWNEALTRCKELQCTLPTLKELQSLVTQTRVGSDWGRINGEVFPQNTRETKYWSINSPFLAGHDRIYMDFKTGKDASFNRENACAVLGIKLTSGFSSSR